MKSRSKIILPKNISLKSLSYSHCASTNDSKQYREYLKKQNSPILKQDSEKIKSIILNNLNKYTTSEGQYFLNHFQTVVNFQQQKNSVFNLNKKLSKICLKDCKFDTLEEHMQAVLKKCQIQKELSQLTEYYKYYTNNPVLYHKEIFKIIYYFYQRKKYVQYKRLKAFLNLQGQSGQNISCSSKNQNISQNSSQVINQDTFYVGPLLNQSQVSQKIRPIKNYEQKDSLCQSEAFQDLHFQMNYLIHNINSKMIPFEKQETFGQNLRSNKNSQPLKGRVQIQELDKMYDFTKKPVDRKIYKNNMRKSQQIHNSSKKEPKSNIKIKQETQNKNKLFTAQIQNLKQQNKFSEFLGKINSKSTNYGRKFKNKRLNSCETVLNNNTIQTIPNNSSKFASANGSVKKMSRNIRSLQKIQTLKSQMARQKVSDFKITIQKQHKFKQRFKRLSNFGTRKSSPELKKQAIKKVVHISGSNNSLDKNMVCKKKDSKKNIQLFYRNLSPNTAKKNSNLSQIGDGCKQQKIKSIKNSKQNVVDCGIEGLKKKIKQQKKMLMELKDLKDSKVLAKRQKKQTIQDDKKRQKGIPHVLKLMSTVGHQKGKK